MIFQGRIVTLRPLVSEDAEITLGWRLSNRARMLQRGSATVAEQANWIRESNIRGDLNFIIEHQGKPVGMESLVDINTRHRTVSMGRLLLGENVHGTPVAFESDLILSDYAFGELGMEKIYGDIMVDNVAMIVTRIYLGYHNDGVLRSHYLYDGKRKDTVAVSILRDEYFETCRPKLVDLLSVMSGLDASVWNLTS